MSIRVKLQLLGNKEAGKQVAAGADSVAQLVHKVS
jgi:hypothetical protein